MTMPQLNPPRLLYILHLPIRAIRSITDPFVDSIMFLLLRVLMPLVWRTISRPVDVISGKFFGVIKKITAWLPEVQLFEAVSTIPARYQVFVCLYNRRAILRHLRGSHPSLHICSPIGLHRESRAPLPITAYTRSTCHNTWNHISLLWVKRFAKVPTASMPVGLD